MSHLLHFYTARWLVLTNYQHHIILFKKNKGIPKTHIILKINVVAVSVRTFTGGNLIQNLHIFRTDRKVKL